MRVISIGILGVVLLISPATAAEIPLTYSAKPIRGTVVNAETGKPLEGVIVVAQWILYWTSVGGMNPLERLQVLETITAKDGTYTFPGWGPKPNRAVIDPGKGYACCFLTNRDPQLNFFKSGYRPLKLLNQEERDSSIRASDWDRKTVRVEPLKGSREEWAKALDFLQTDLGWGNDMDWKRVPRMTLAIIEARKPLPPRLRSRVEGAEALGTTEDEVRRFIGR